MIQTCISYSKKIKERFAESSYMQMLAAIKKENMKYEKYVAPKMSMASNGRALREVSETLEQAVISYKCAECVNNTINLN